MLSKTSTMGSNKKAIKRINTTRRVVTWKEAERGIWNPPSCIIYIYNQAKSHSFFYLFIFLSLSLQIYIILYCIGRKDISSTASVCICKGRVRGALVRAPSSQRRFPCFRIDSFSSWQTCLISVTSSSRSSSIR